MTLSVFSWAYWPLYIFFVEMSVHQVPLPEKFFAANQELVPLLEARFSWLPEQRSASFCWHQSGVRQVSLPWTGQTPHCFGRGVTGFLIGCVWLIHHAMAPPVSSPAEDCHPEQPQAPPAVQQARRAPGLMAPPDLVALSAP